MRKRPVEGPEVWSAAELAADESWILRVTDGQRAELSQAVEALGDRPTEAIDRDLFAVPGLAPLLDSIIDIIAGGRGVALLRGVPIEGLSVEVVERMFWGIACHIGYPEPQDATGKRLHHVRAEQSFADAAEARQGFQKSRSLRGYQTNAELHFHGDGSDALMFLCRSAGKSGGLSRVVSAGRAFNAVLAQDPDLAMALQEDYIFDARGELGPDRPTQTAPIFAECAGRLNILYKRGYIELAQHLPGVPPLSERQVAAMDALDAALNDPANYHEFLLAPGDIEIANNYNILHSRTAFEDHDEAARKRHMLRIWATLRRDRRPLPAAYQDTREFAASHRRRIALGDPA